MTTRRDNGAGTITQRENGKWSGRVYIGKSMDGKPKYKYFSGKTQAEVRKEIKEFGSDKDQTTATKTTVEQYLDNWMKLYKYGTIKQSSYDSIERTFRNYIQPRIGVIQLQKLTTNDIQQLLQNLKNEVQQHQ